MREAVIVSGARTAIGGFGGALKDVPAIDLAALVIRETLKRADLRPAPSTAMQDAAPDALKNQGLIELEKKASAWNGAMLMSCPAWNAAPRRLSLSRTRQGHSN